MAKVYCAMCGDECDPRNKNKTEWCPDCRMWFHYKCVDFVGMFSTFARCPRCGGEFSS